MKKVKKVKINKTAKECLACYCGIDCSRCSLFRATVDNNEALREKSRIFYKNVLNIDVPPDKLHCRGGRSGEAFYLCSGCPWIKCCREKGLRSCSDCDNYPCAALSAYREKYRDKLNRVDD